MNLRRRRQKWLGRTILVLLLLLIVVAVAAAAGEMLPRSVISGGGGSVNGGPISLHSAIGQPIVGAVSGTENVLCSGFWCGPGAPEVSEGEFILLLPVAIRP